MGNWSDWLRKHPEAQTTAARERLAIALARLPNVLERQGVACIRTLEMKISDGGPIEQRAEPHFITIALRELVDQRGFVRQHTHVATGDTPWYAPSRSPQGDVDAKLDLLATLYQQTTVGGIKNIIGQALEKVVLDVLKEMEERIQGCGFQGHIDPVEIIDLGEYRIFKKYDPPSQYSGKTSKKRGDFYLILPGVGTLLIECKNFREWLYPQHGEIKSTIIKAAELGLPPVLVARKLPYVTREVLCRPAGIITHESYYQYYPSDLAAYRPADPAGLASIIEQAKRKELLGYADIRQKADPRTRKFFMQDLPVIAPEMGARFKRNIPVLLDFARNNIGLDELRRKLRS